MLASTYAHRWTKDYQVPFRFTGKLDKLTIKLAPEQLMDEDQKAKAEAIAQVTFAH